MTNLINQTLNNRYRLEALLGDGGMVWHCTWTARGCSTPPWPRTSTPRP